MSQSTIPRSLPNIFFFFKVMRTSSSSQVSGSMPLLPCDAHALSNEAIEFVQKESKNFLRSAVRERVKKEKRLEKNRREKQRKKRKAEEGKEKS